MQLGSDPTIPPDQLEYMAEAQSGLMLTMLVGQGVLSRTATVIAARSRHATAAVTLNGNPLPFGVQ